jgi:hypothetical protein
VTVTQGTQLYWRTLGPHMHINAGSGISLGGGGAPDGAAIVPPGTYANVQIDAKGRWWLEVR